MSDRATAEAFLAAYMPELTPWQERAAVALLSDDYRQVSLASARRSGLASFRSTLDQARAAMAQRSAPDTTTASGAPQAR